MALSTEDKSAIAAMIAASEERVRARIALAEVDILREVIGKLQAGFNESVPTFLDRQSAGDKKVITVAVEQ